MTLFSILFLAVFLFLLILGLLWRSGVWTESPKLLLSFPETRRGDSLSPAQVTQEPRVEFPLARPGQLFTLMLTDPDAPQPEYLHWLIVNIPAFDPKQGDELLAWEPPRPPSGQTHHYVFRVFSQNSRLGLAAPATRLGFLSREFVAKNQLRPEVARAFRVRNPN
jgi:hypothetical protein